MPRRKTPQPKPLERFKVDGVEAEVRDADTWYQVLLNQKDWEPLATRQ